MDEPKRCCRLAPEVFTDIKVGSKVRMWVVACVDCGKYSDGPTRANAIESWDGGYRTR